MKKKEIIFIGAILAVAILGFFGYRYFANNAAEVGVIMYNNKVYLEFDVNVDATYELDGVGVIMYNNEVYLEFDVNVDATYELDGDYGHMYVEVKDGSWRVTREECPNHICSSIGWVSVKDYFPIVCFPNDVIVTLKD